MSYSTTIEVNESVIELEKLLQQQKSYKLKQRIKGLLLFKKYPDRTQETLSNQLGVGYSTYRLWLKQYSKEGIGDFLTSKTKGRVQTSISPELHIELAKKVNDSQYPLKGYWDAVIWVKEEFGIEVNYQTLRAYLKRNFGTKLKMPRKSHYKKDEQAIEAFKKTS